MPEAAIDKYGEVLFAEDEIRPAGQGKVPPPAGDAVRPEDGDELQLGILVSARSDGSHDLRALGLGKYVSH